MDQHEPNRGPGSADRAPDRPALGAFFGALGPAAGPEPERRQAEQRLRRIIDAAPTAMVIANERGVMTLVNAQTETLFGYARAELLGSPVEMLIPARFRDRHGSFRDAFFQKPDVRAMGLGRDLYGLRKDGSEVPIEIGLNPLTFVEGSVIASIVDITERKRAQERLRLIVDAAPIAMLMIDARAAITLVNTQCEALFGYPRETLLGQPVEILIPERFRAGHPKLRASFMSAPQARFMGAGRDLHGRRRDGSEFPVEVGLNPIETADGRSVVASIIDITERKRTESLQAAVEAAEAATRAKSGFLAAMSHELRTPITGILAAVDLLGAPHPQSERQVLIDALRTSARTLSSVVGDILDFSKIEAGHVSLETIDFDLRQIVRGALNAAESVAAGKGLGLALNWPGDGSHVVRGDPTRLRQVLTNLIDNAIKFTIRGVVTVSVDAPQPAAPDLWSFSVRDSGMGISEEVCKRLFAPFTQADESTTRRFGGTGLGLAICKSLVEAMGGQIGVESTIGTGSKFWFTVLLAPGDASATGAVSTSDPFRPATQSLRILLAEDNAVSRLLVGKMLERMGHTVTAVDDGRKAVAAAKAGTFDLVVMDMQMPEMDGVEATKGIRCLGGATALVPIIALTADALTEHRHMYDGIGLTGFVTKPIDPGTLRAALDGIAEATHAPTIATPSSLDKAHLAMLRDTLGDVAIVELLTVFARDVSERLDAARAALAAGDEAALEGQAHAIKGAAGNVGASAVAAYALELERTISENGDVRAVFERLTSSIGFAVNAARDVAR